MNGENVTINAQDVIDGGQGVQTLLGGGRGEENPPQIATPFLLESKSLNLDWAAPTDQYFGLGERPVRVGDAAISRLVNHAQRQGRALLFERFRAL